MPSRGFGARSRGLVGDALGLARRGPDGGRGPSSASISYNEEGKGKAERRSIEALVK